MQQRQMKEIALKKANSRHKDSDVVIFLDAEFTCFGNYETKPEGWFPEPVEVAIIKTEKSGKVLEKQHTFIKPKYFNIVSKKLNELTGITENILNNGISIEEFLDWLPPHVENRKIFTWGDKDRLRLRLIYKKEKVKTPFTWGSFIDLAEEYRLVNGFKKRIRLVDAGTYLNLKVKNSHRALEDADLLRKIYFRLKEDKTWASSFKKLVSAFNMNSKRELPVSNVGKGTIVLLEEHYFLVQQKTIGKNGKGIADLFDINPDSLWVDFYKGRRVILDTPLTVSTTANGVVSIFSVLGAANLSQSPINH